MYSVISVGSDFAKVSEIGATLMEWSINDRQTDIIYPFGNIGDKKRGGVPICCPFFGSTPVGFEGISQHGWLRDRVIDQYAINDNHVISYGRYFGLYKEVYPWKLSYDIQHVLQEKTLITNLYIKRLFDYIEGRGAPIVVAFHPYFISHGKSDVYINGKKCISSFSSIAENVMIDSEDEIIIDTGKFKIKMSLENFDYNTCLYLWSDSSKYFCVEPVLMLPDDFNTSKGLWLRQSDSIDVSMILSIV